jgi:phage-related protein
MTIRESLYFTYAGISSTTYGITNVSISTGLYEEPFLSSRSIREQKIRGNDKPYFQEIEGSPLQISITFAFDDVWDDAKIREVARWLGSQTYYQPLHFSENPNRIFYCLAVDDSSLIHNGLKQGYVQMTMRCDSPYSYSPTYTSQLYDYSANVAGGTKLEFTNEGDLPLKPEIWITKVGVGDVSIFNESNGNIEFKFTSLDDTEMVYVDNENEYIESDKVPITYRYSNFNNNYLKLFRGKSVLNIVGNCKIQLRYKYRTLQG